MRIFIASAFVALAVAACDSADVDSVLSLGVVLPLSGTLAEAGTEIQSGMMLAQDEINESGLLGDTKLSLLVQNNRSSPDQTAAAFDMLISKDRVPAILGPLTSSSTSRIVSLVDAAGIVAVSPTSSATGIAARSEWVFCASLAVDRLVPFGIAVTKRHLNYTRAATIVNGQDTFSKSGNAKITEVLQADADVAIVLAQSYSRAVGTRIGDLTSELTAVQNADPDVTFLSGLPEDYIGVITQAHALGTMDIPFICPLLASTDVHSINEEAPGAAEGSITLQAWVAASEVSLSKAFVNSYTARRGGAPGDFAASGYATTYIAATAIANAANYQAASIRSELAET